MPILHIDYETFSLADLSEVGAYRYANDPSTEILCAGMALDDEEPVGWYDWGRFNVDRTDFSRYEPFWDALEDPSVTIWAHNAQFEMAISQALMEKTWGIKCPDLSRWRCTANLARRASLPHKLETLAETLGLTELKDKQGKKLIKKFSMVQEGKAKKPSKKNPQGVAAPPNYRIRPEDEPEAFCEFLRYCQQDVRVEQLVHRKLAYFADPLNDATYLLDAQINSRGVPVNLDGLRKAQEIIEEESKTVFAEFRELTGCNPTQGAKFREWLEEQGVSLPNLQAATIEEWLLENDLDDSPADRALKMKQDTAYASISKISTMLACAGPHDNRVRGMLVHHGATTGRWTNVMVQFQNMKRPTIKHSEAAYRDLCNGMSRDMIDCCYGPPLEVLSSCIRHFVHDTRDGWTGRKCPRCGGYGEYEAQQAVCSACGGTGDEYTTSDRPMLDADYAAIEARIISWLAGQEDALQQYRAYDAAATPEEQKELDPYRILAATIYGIPLSQVEKFPHRLVGKHAKLGCGFGMGPPKFRGTVKVQGNYDLPEGLEQIAVAAYRKTNKNIVRFWYALEAAAKKAIINKGEIVRPVPKHLRGESFSTPLPKFQRIEFLCKDIEGMPFLLCKLPSGRKLAYPRPRIVPSRKFEEGTSIVFLGHIKGTMWGEVDTYGGKLAENCLSGESLVLSETRGWVRLDTICQDRVWDGLEFVSHGGLVNRGVQLVIGLEGLRATPDHEFLTVEYCWVSAKIACTDTTVKLASVNEAWFPPAPWSLLERCTGDSGESRELVYDLINCGPRNRFAVRGSSGRILIAHNCTQGVAADVMAAGAMNAEKAGYEIATLVHDEAPAYYYPERGQTIEEYKTLLATLPEWGKGLPVAAEGSIIPFYKKD